MTAWGDMKLIWDHRIRAFASLGGSFPDHGRYHPLLCSGIPTQVEFLKERHGLYQEDTGKIIFVALLGSFQGNVTYSYLKTVKLGIVFLCVCIVAILGQSRARTMISWILEQACKELG